MIFTFHYYVKKKVTFLEDCYTVISGYWNDNESKINNYCKVKVDFCKVGKETVD